MRYQVPQFVDIEDKIVGPFTLKQFLIYLGGVFVLIPTYLVFDMSLFITLALPVMGTCAMFAHLRVQGKSLAAAISNAIAFMVRGQYFVWRRVAQPGKFLIITGPELGSFSANGPAAVPSTTMLSDQARRLETEGHIGSEEVADVFSGEAQE